MRGIFPLARREGRVQVKGDEGGDVHHALLVPELRGPAGEDFPQEKKDNLNIYNFLQVKYPSFTPKFHWVLRRCLEESPEYFD